MELFPEAVMRDVGWSGDTVVRQELKQLCRGAERSASRLGGRGRGRRTVLSGLGEREKKNPTLNSCGNYGGTFLRSQMSLVQGGRVKGGGGEFHFAHVFISDLLNISSPAGEQSQGCVRERIKIVWRQSDALRNCEPYLKRWV